MDDGGKRPVQPVHSRGKFLVISQTDGDILLYRPVTAIPDRDSDIGEIPLPAPRELLTVPVFFRWRDGTLPKDRLFFLTIWKPKAAGKEADAVWSASFNTPLQAGRVQVGIARNLPPGEYEVEVKFLAGQQAELPPFRQDFRVGRPVQPLVLEAPTAGR